MSTPDVCQATEDEDGIWETDCGEQFPSSDDITLFSFCPFCGGKLDAIKFSPPPTRAEIEEERGDRAYQEMKDNEP